MKLPAIFRKKSPAAEKMPLAQWIWRAYCNSVLLPLLCMQLVLLGFYFVSLAMGQHQQLQTLQQLADAEAKQRTQLQANSISQQLATIAQTATFLQQHSAQLIKQHSLRGAAATARQVADVSVALAPVYRGLALSNPHITQVYYSSDGAKHQPYRQGLARSAAALHQPGSAALWTDIYQDKSTLLWLSSLLVPVYSAERLQGVVAVDVRLDRLLSAVVDLNTAGYAMLLGGDGKVVAIPALGARHWAQAVASTPAPGAASMKLSPAALAAADNGSILLAQINANNSGVSHADFGGMHLVSWAQIAQTGWKLVVAVPTMPALNKSADQHGNFGWYLACVFFGLHLLFIFVLYRQARKMSLSLSAPLAHINQLLSTITAGHDLPPLTDAEIGIAETGITEFSQTAQGVVLMGLLLDVASKSRQLAEAELEQRNRQLQSVFDLSPDGLVLTDEHSQVVLVNPALCQLTGVNPAEYLFKSDQLLWQKLVQLSTTPELVLPGALASFRLELETPHKCVLQCQILNMNQQHSSTAVKLIQLRDITRDAAVDQMKSEFITTAAHELRTPLTSVLGYSELLLKDMIPAAMRTEALAIVVSKTKLVINIINEMLDLARIEARHGMDFNIKPYLADVLVQDVLASYQLPPLRSPIISSSLADLRVNVDQDKFKAVLTNVLDNAYKYSSSGDVQLQIIEDHMSDQRRVGFRVRDAGIGMNPQQAQHAFERFWRADASGNIPGTGLGLAIVKEVMRVLGGSVDIESTPGVGTTLTLWLPAVDDGA